MDWNSIRTNFGDGLESIKLPEFYNVTQPFDNRCIEDLCGAVMDGLTAKTEGMQFNGMRIAITAGSRGIKGVDVITKTLVKYLQSKGALPFIITAMGSHGGATNEGQLQLIASYGITEENMGCPVVASMETVYLGDTPSGVPVYFDKVSFNADGIIVLNKIKPHADFKGDFESGLVKMMAIGLGKHKGATVLHDYGFARFKSILSEVASVILQKAPVLFGLAIVENACDEPQIVEVILPGDILGREKQLLVTAKNNVAKILLKEVDILVIDEIGKNISGEGMDPNVTGRPGSYLYEGFDNINIHNIVVRDITEESHGNGVGIGMADLTTVRCAQKLDFAAMYTNAVTAAILGPARLPPVMNNDLTAIKVAMRISTHKKKDELKIVRVKNTLELSYVQATASCLDELKNNGGIVESGPFYWEFDTDGYLISTLGGNGWHTQ